ncbi:EamA-like transporter family protein [methanogenic archaeon mixed culture ISO4-G1]|nr:EamA-like transporter family protein [methanogenic archaeon mixed culture ISO4-G1]
MMSNKVAGFLAALTAGIVWGLLGPVVRDLNDAGIDSSQITCIRFTVVGLIVLAYLLVKNRKELMVDGRTMIILLATGIIGTVFSSVCYLGAMDYISLGLACVLEFINPFLVVLICVPLLHEPLTTTKGASCIIAFVGCIMCMELITKPGFFDMWGITLGLLSGLFFAVHTIGIKVVANRGYSSLNVLFYTSIICGLALMPFCNIGGAIDVFAADGDALIRILFLSTALTFIPSLLFIYSVEKIDAGIAAIITFVEPMAAAIVGYVFYGETMGIESLIGVTLILIALVLVNRKGKVIIGGNDPTE